MLEFSFMGKPYGNNIFILDMLLYHPKINVFFL